MKQVVSFFGIAGVLAASGCGGGGSSTVTTAVSSRVTAVQSGLATLRAGGVIGTLNTLTNSALSAQGASGNLQVTNPCDLTGGSALYLVPSTGLTSLHADAFSDPQHTTKAGSLDITESAASGAGTGVVTFNNFGNCANGQANLTLNGTGNSGAVNNGTIQFVRLSLGSDLAVDGTLNLMGSKDSTGKINSTIFTGATPLTLTLAGQPFLSNVQLNETFDPTAHTVTTTGTTTTRDPLGDTALTIYNPGGGSSTIINNSSGTKVVSETVAPGGMVSVTAFAPNGTSVLSKVYPSALNVNVNDFQ